MSYTFMSISKIKTMGSMVSKYNHNYRKVEVSNAISEMSEMNEELIPLPRHSDGTEMRYDEAFRERIENLPYYKEHKIRGDQVLGYEVLLTYSKDENIDVEKWKSQSVEWLHKTFDVAGDGQSNLLGAVFHADETGNVHIHAFVVPVDERGHLNARRFTNGSRAMSSLQSSYADSVKDLGLQRGLAGSSAEHKVIRKMYADMNAAANIPEPLLGETAVQYKERIKEEAETMYLTRYKAACDFERNSRRQADEYRIQQSRAAREDVELERSRHAGDIEGLKKEKTKLQSEVSAAKEELSSYQDQIEALTQQMYELRTTVKTIEEERKGAIRAGRIQVGIELIRQEDPNRADRMEDDINEAIARAEAREAREALAKQEPQETLA